MKICLSFETIVNLQRKFTYFYQLANFFFIKKHQIKYLAEVPISYL